MSRYHILFSFIPLSVLTNCFYFRWGIDPNLSERFPLAFEYLYSNKTQYDFFITGDSGAGYVNPTGLLPPRLSGLPSAEQLWISHNAPYYQKFDISFTGFIINGNDGVITRPCEAMYASFSGDGVVDEGGYTDDGPHLNGNLPVLVQSDLPQRNISECVQAILTQAKTSNFHMWRSILMPRGWYKQLAAALYKAAGDNVVIVDPYTLGYLVRVYFGGNNDNRATYMSDTFPRSAAAGTKVPSVSVLVRNEGWNAWTHADFQLTVSYEVNGSVHAYNLTSPSDIASGTTGVFSGTWVAPSTAPHTATQVTYELRMGRTPFSTLGTLPYVFTFVAQ